MGLTGQGKNASMEMNCLRSLSKLVSAALHVVQHGICPAVLDTLSPGVISSLHCSSGSDVCELQSEPGAELTCRRLPS